MKNAMDAEQSGTWVPEITPFIPLILGNYILDTTIRMCYNGCIR